MPIKGFEGKYEVSNLGRIKSLDRFVSGKSNSMQMRKGRILKPQVASKYAQVYLNVDGKQKWFKVHRLVADAFIPNPNEYPIINHRDGNTLNNVVSNLEWCDSRYNSVYGVILRNNLDITVDEYLDARKEKKRKYYRQHYKNYKSSYKQYYLKNREKILERYNKNK